MESEDKRLMDQGLDDFNIDLLSKQLSREEKYGNLKPQVSRKPEYFPGKVRKGPLFDELLKFQGERPSFNANKDEVLINEYLSKFQENL